MPLLELKEYILLEKANILKKIRLDSCWMRIISTWTMPLLVLKEAFVLKCNIVLFQKTRAYTIFALARNCSRQTCILSSTFLWKYCLLL